MKTEGSKTGIIVSSDSTALNELKVVEELLNKEYIKVIYGYELLDESFWITEKGTKIVVLGVDSKHVIREVNYEDSILSNHLYTTKNNANIRDELLDGKHPQFEGRVTTFIIDSLYDASLTYWLNEDDSMLEEICNVLGEDHLEVISDAIDKHYRLKLSPILDKDSLTESLNLESMQTKIKLKELVEEDDFHMVSITASRLETLRNVTKKYIDFVYGNSENTGK
ncbi:hypothetical protein COF68_05475 [Bacillus toyonensis]|uniref:hypothetical protein n=1 Tax=Bacillus toyonensis TaxID=155322 RepID=UPI000BFE7DDB|nr:hypothetical protein [Bacillus toyonensis]PHE64293.1 hypothetical protein COF68_05475 [Bacillus toyonensis]